MIRKPVLIETRPVVPESPVRSRKRLLILYCGSRYVFEASISGLPVPVRTVDGAVRCFQPLAKSSLASFAIANVSQLVGHDVVEQLRVMVHGRNGGADVFGYCLADTWALEAN